MNLRFSVCVNAMVDLADIQHCKTHSNIMRFFTLFLFVCSVCDIMNKKFIIRQNFI